MVCIQPAQPHPNTLDYHSNGLVCCCCCCFMLDLYSEYVAVHASKCWLFIALVYAQQMLFHQNLLYQSHSCVFSFHFCYIKAFWQAKSWYKMTIEFWYEVFFEVQSKRSWTSMMSEPHLQNLNGAVSVREKKRFHGASQTVWLTLSLKCLNSMDSDNIRLTMIDVYFIPFSKCSRVHCKFGWWSLYFDSITVLLWWHKKYCVHIKFQTSIENAKTQSVQRREKSKRPKNDLIFQRFC